MKLKIIAGSLLASALFAGIGVSPAIAQSIDTPRIDRSQEEIRARIQQGLASGQITPAEAQSLYQREREIQILEGRFKSDGFTSPEDRQQIRQDLDVLRAEVERIISSRRAVAQQLGDSTPGIDRTQQEISARIQQGLASGHITPTEAQSLNRREREIQIRESRFKADGSASPQERQQLRQDLEALRVEVERIIATPRAVGQRSDNTPGIDRSQQEISARIQQGLASGHITPTEAQSLNRREREIQIRESRFKSDGSASPQERQQLRQDLEALRAEVESIMASPRVVVQQPDNTSDLDRSHEEISDRIEEGVRTRRITEREGRRLDRREREIERHEDRFNADGVLTLLERRQLKNELTALRNDVERLMRRQRRGR